jgi:hypothetical protein
VDAKLARQIEKLQRPFDQLRELKALNQMSLIANLSDIG